MDPNIFASDPNYGLSPAQLLEKQTSTLVTYKISLWWDWEVKLGAAPELMSFINLTGSHCAFDYNLNYNSNGIQQAIKHMRLHAFFMRCWLLCPLESSSSSQLAQSLLSPASTLLPYLSPISSRVCPVPSLVPVLATLELTMTCSSFELWALHICFSNTPARKCAGVHCIYFSILTAVYTNCFH